MIVAAVKLRLAESSYTDIQFYKNRQREEEKVKKEVKRVK